MRSETSKVRENLAKFCTGNGLDLGPGGDKILPSAISVDLPEPYTVLGLDSVELKGDASNLFWFRDKVLDFVYSSHLLEDFEDTYSVMKEWTRVLKPGGHLVLYLPDERLFKAHCAQTGQPGNNAHKHENFGAMYIIRIASQLANLELLHLSDIINDYSFEIVFKKVNQCFGPIQKFQNKK